jgi:hypothetical protein
MATGSYDHGGGVAGAQSVIVGPRRPGCGDSAGIGIGDPSAGFAGSAASDAGVTAVTEIADALP